MRAPFFNMISKGRLAWLVGLLLLMPLAQAAANWHLIAHTHAQASQRADDTSTGLSDYCDLCQAAAAVSSGLLPTPTAATPTVALPVAVPGLAATAALLAPAWPPYASRAPPKPALN